MERDVETGGGHDRETAGGRGSDGGHDGRKLEDSQDTDDEIDGGGNDEVDEAVFDENVTYVRASHTIYADDGEDKDSKVENDGDDVFYKVTRLNASEKAAASAPWLSGGSRPDSMDIWDTGHPSSQVSETEDREKDNDGLSADARVETEGSRGKKGTAADGNLYLKKGDERMGDKKGKVD